ncbi:MAG: DUF1987 domain-containing protein [Magnetococcales bacterium]|nr:DUF1987 domain-containing protein [Magnetococcales bacterium]
MEKLLIEPTRSSPRIRFDGQAHLLEVTGESYPEDAAMFYRPVFEWLTRYLEGLAAGVEVRVKLDVNYFNSSTSKIFMDLFELLDDHVRAGKTIVAEWISHEENDMGIEFGEEFQECVTDLPIHVVTRA